MTKFTLDPKDLPAFKEAFEKFAMDMPHAEMEMALMGMRALGLLKDTEEAPNATEDDRALAIYCFGISRGMMLLAGPPLVAANDDK